MNFIEISGKMKAIGLAGMLVAFGGAANASVYDFSYSFVDNGLPAGKISGSFTGTGPLSDITNIGNISAELNGTPITGPLIAWSYTPSGPNCGLPSCFTIGGATVSNIGNSNFVFTTAATSTELAASNYFYIIQPWTNGSPAPYSDTVATQYAFGGTPNTYIDNYNGQFIPRNFGVTRWR
jgi:hypothetical protein